MINWILISFANGDKTIEAHIINDITLLVLS